MCRLTCRLSKVSCSRLGQKKEMAKEDRGERVRFTAGTRERERGEGGKEGMG